MGDTLVGRAPQVFRKQFSQHLLELGIGRVGYKPYSLRRGGATTSFLETGNIGMVTVAGRWQSQNTARIYINDGMKVLAETTFTESATSKIKASCNVALSVLRAT